MSIFDNNRYVDNRHINELTPGWDFGKYGNYWCETYRNIPLILDMRSRSELPFVTPWGCDTHPEYMRLPKLQYTDKSLSDILDERAITLFNRAVQDDKRIWIMWSGGIDSTTLLSAFIRTIDPVLLKQRVSVVMSANTIAENFYFYSKFVHNQFETINWLDIDVNQELLENVIVLHGDPANALLSCSTVSAFSSLIESGRHLLPFRQNPDVVVEGITTMATKTGKNPLPGWAEWFVNKVINAIPESDSATSIASFWWWNYVNFKWHGSMLRPFFFTRSTFNKPILEEQFKYYYETCFYVSDDLQHWSYSNIDRIAKNPNDYKPEMRDYIYTVSGDELYTKYKGFKASRRTNMNYALQYGNNVPMLYKEDWTGVLASKETLDQIKEKLTAYRG